MAKLRLFLLPIIACLALPVWAGAIDKVEFNSLPDGQVQLQFDFDGTPPTPKVYTIDSPARIALDLQGTSSNLKERRHTLDMGNTRSVTVVQAQDRTRIIVNLLKMVQYKTKVDGNKLIVTIGTQQAKDYLTASNNQSQLENPSSAAAASEITSIDFRRGDNNEGRLIVKLSNPNINIDSQVEGKYIKLLFANTALPKKLHLNYDVSDFATPVSSFKAKDGSQGAEIDILPTGEYDYLAYQTDSTYVLTVKPMTKEEIKAKAKEFQYVGDKLSLNFQNIDVRAVLQLIADFTDMNLVASDSVQGKITLRLQNVPWDQALDLILKTKGLDKRLVGNVLMVAPAAEIAAREKQEIQSKKQIQDLAPLQTEFIRVRYAKAADIFALLQGKKASGSDTDTGKAESSGTLLSSRATVVVDARTNSLLITETADKLEQIHKLINLIDVPVRQVVIEARIVSANASDASKLGIQWGATGDHQDDSGRTVVVGGSNTAAGSTGGSTPIVTTGVPVPYSNIVDLGVTDQGATNFSLGFISGDARKLINLQLSAIESSGHGEVVTQPKVITGDKQKAMIKNGTQIPYQETSPNGASTVSFKDAVLELSVTPNITPDNRIIMELDIKQDSPGETAVNGTPVIDTTQIQTNVLVDNGETVVLGGVFQTQESEAVVKTPFFGDLPLIGRLFRRTITNHQKTELLIFITPRILTDSLVE